MAEGNGHAAPPSSPGREAAREMVERFILEELMFGADRSDLTAGVRLVSDGMIDSMSALRLVYFLEATFDVTIPPEQVNAENLDSIESIVDCIEMNRPLPPERKSLPAAS
jgi:acyl carrier protein